MGEEEEGEDWQKKPDFQTSQLAANPVSRTGELCGLRQTAASLSLHGLICQERKITIVSYKLL